MGFSCWENKLKKQPGEGSERKQSLMLGGKFERQEVAAFSVRVLKSEDGGRVSVRVM